MYINARVMTIIPEKGSKDKEIKNSRNVIRIAKKNMILHLSWQNSKKERIVWKKISFSSALNELTELIDGENEVIGKCLSTRINITWFIKRKYIEEKEGERDCRRSFGSVTLNREASDPRGIFPRLPSSISCQSLRLPRLHRVFV